MLLLFTCKQVLFCIMMHCKEPAPASHYVLTWRQDHPELARKALLLSSVRPGFPSLFWGREREFEAANILAVHGEKHKSLRAAWQPMFFSGRLTRCIIGCGYDTQQKFSSNMLSLSL